MSLLIAATRIWIKKNAFGLDDTLFVAATVAMVAHVIAVAVALKNGLGTSSSAIIQQDIHGDLNTAGSATLAAYMLLIVALALAKGSTIMFVQRILSRDLRQLYVICYVLLAVFAAWAVGSMVALGAHCEGTGYVTESMAIRCGNQRTRWALISALDCLTEVLLIFMPLVVVWPLQLSFSLKTQVVTAFMFRAGVAALSITHAIYTSRTSVSLHPSLAFVPAIILAEAELCWSLTSATIPNLKSFMKSFNTGFGHNDFGSTSNPTITASRKRTGDDIPLQSFARNKDDFRPDRYAYDAEIVRGRDDRSIESGNSQELIIRKTVEHEVTFEGEGCGRRAGRKCE